MRLSGVIVVAAVLLLISVGSEATKTHKVGTESGGKGGQRDKRKRRSGES